MATDANFTEDQNKLWAELYKRIWPRVQAGACGEYLEGLERLALPADRIPSVSELNEQITGRVGWTVERTNVRYSDAVQWYTKFGQRIFIVTDYMRSWEEIDWTPEPDMFHDIFGHLPFMTLKRYALAQELFAPAFLAAKTDEQRDNIKRLAWFTMEFGLIREKGERKLFGAGLLSGASELDNSLGGKMVVEPFTVENVLGHDKAVWEQNSILFEFESLDAMTAEVRRYFDPILAGEEPRLES
jgi:phenylalanine-4-hydroxylase